VASKTAPENIYFTHNLLFWLFSLLFASYRVILETLRKNPLSRRPRRAERRRETRLSEMGDKREKISVRER
jgi:hypothetical protein